MIYFNMRLSEWVSLGMSESHVKSMTDEESLAIFGLDKEEVLSITRTFSRPSVNSPSNAPTAMHNMNTEC